MSKGERIWYFVLACIQAYLFIAYGDKFLNAVSAKEYLGYGLCTLAWGCCATLNFYISIFSNKY